MHFSAYRMLEHDGLDEIPGPPTGRTVTAQPRGRTATLAYLAIAVENDSPNRDLMQTGDEDLDDGIAQLNTLRAHEIELARDAIRRGVYGACAVCGKDIPLPRMKAVPTAVECKPCKTESEKTGGGARLANGREAVSFARLRDADNDAPVDLRDLTKHD